jgi:hypothetical protein
VHAVEHISQGIEILTGVKAGERSPSGEFPPGTVYRLVEDKLRVFAERARAFGSRSNSTQSSNGDRTS